ncbi:MAG: bis(5'-nucleosyl)-tetraphosphatase (symmetrical) YqeK [Elusimicrobiota bacterium]
MKSPDDIKYTLQTLMTERRFKHSAHVARIAKALGARYGENENDCEIAGYLHDSAKDIPFAHLPDFGVNPDKIPNFKTLLARAPGVIHSYAGEQIAANLFGIKNNKILNAVKRHTTGCKNMSLIDKIIFVSDCIEPLRKFDGVNEIRRYAYRHLDKALELAFISKIRTVLDYKGYMCGETIDAWNDIVTKGCKY